MKLELNGRYTLFSGDEIEVLEACMSNTKEATEKGFKSYIMDGKSEPICRARIVKKNRSPFADIQIAESFRSSMELPYPGKNEGDVLEYLCQDGLLAGFDSRRHWLHVKDAVK